MLYISGPPVSRQSYSSLVHSQGSGLQEQRGHSSLGEWSTWAAGLVGIMPSFTSDTSYWLMIQVMKSEVAVFYACVKEAKLLLLHWG